MSTRRSEDTTAPVEPKRASELAGQRMELADARTDLAVERTVMAANRTLMAWVRTALSLISFGFVIYKFLQAAIEGAEGAKLALLRTQGPRRLGLTLIALGTMAVILGAIEYYETVKRLSRQSATSCKPLNFSFILGMAIGLLGLFLFITILINREVF
jgi:putative membrane protein